ncbi:nose resistant to fluoxetine protein 6 [Zeugodacus cucurbitae]|uniref:Nose resistant to fluoxetine protein 6 n=1 Tax=Zeugodacus cucurbitae TaxID=28588 RepID=A0A0A1X2L2_ZEUCU|nr:nose resistant to fluoxetine protein 6 [Zeugodacus cucurbitae]XP_054090703.1 nose resistant to fluoxetine protein 6 [Zeugodacus cucurbitae]XP_054090704.1 nose resistant to fluoxetine protein 6 [Zeugodacus cucurbitae]
MNNFNLFVLVNIFITAKLFIVIGQFNMSIYRKMPSLYQFDDYDHCLQSDNAISNIRGTYCVVYAEIVEDETSSLWNEIAKFSADNRHHFRHDRLFFGVCLERCKQLLQTGVKFSQQKVGKNNTIHDTELIEYYFNVHKRETDNRILYGELVSHCINYDFHKNFGLGLRTSIEYCEEANVSLEYDSLDVAVYVILAIIALTSIFSTIYDYRLKTKQTLSSQNNGFYKVPLESAEQQLWVSYSICRNFYQIHDLLESQRQTSKDLRFFDGLRVIGVFLVLFAHSLILFMAIQVENPEFYETFFYRPETAIIENGAAIIQIFFVMSGFLLYVNFNERNFVTTNTSIVDCIITYFKIFFHRYLRLLPSLIMLVLFNSTILVRLQNGPFWRHYVEAERVFCRELWWQNLLFVNNYLLKESCSHQTWYLAADMQLFELFLIILIIINKFPKLRLIIYSILLVLSFSVTGFITYFLKLKPIYHTNPENYRYMFFRNAETFFKAYTPFYTNIGGYFFGIISAEFYLKFRNKSKQYCGLLKYELSWWLIFPIAFGLLFAGAFVMSFEIHEPSIWIALFANLYRNMWALICCTAILGMCLKLGWIAYEFCSLPFLRILSKLSYQAFLWHLVVLRLIGGFYRQPIYINRFYLICQIIVAFVMTQIVAFVFALFLEYPIASIIKYLLPYYKDERKQSKRDVHDLNQVVVT